MLKTKLEDKTNNANKKWDLSKGLPRAAWHKKRKGWKVKCLHLGHLDELNVMSPCMNLAIEQKNYLLSSSYHY